MAALLETSTDAVNSTLRRARAAMDQADLDLELLGQYVEAFGIHVLECDAGRIAAIHAFLDPGLFAAFGLPQVATTFRDPASCTGWMHNDPQPNRSRRPKS